MLECRVDFTCRPIIIVKNFGVLVLDRFSFSVWYQVGCCFLVLSVNAVTSVVTCSGLPMCAGDWMNLWWKRHSAASPSHTGNSTGTEKQRHGWTLSKRPWVHCRFSPTGPPVGPRLVTNSYATNPRLRQSVYITIGFGLVTGRAPLPRCPNFITRKKVLKIIFVCKLQMLLNNLFSVWTSINTWPCYFQGELNLKFSKVSHLKVKPWGSSVQCMTDKA